MEKVKLPKEVAEAIEEFIRCGETNYDLMIAVIGTADSKSATTLRKYSSDGGFTNIMNALVNGYEVEETQEDKVREYYNTLERDSRAVKYHMDSQLDNQHHALTHAEMNGIVRTLERLGIKIEGVNA